MRSSSILLLSHMHSGEHLLKVVQDRRLRRLQREGLVRRVVWPFLNGVDDYVLQVSMHGEGNSSGVELGQA